MLPFLSNPAPPCRSSCRLSATTLKSLIRWASSTRILVFVYVAGLHLHEVSFYKFHLFLQVSVVLFWMVFFEEIRWQITLADTFGINLFRRTSEFRPTETSPMLHGPSRLVPHQVVCTVPRITIGKAYAHHRKTIGNPKEHHRKTTGNQRTITKSKQ